MIKAIREFYAHIDELSQEEYETFIMKRIEELIKERLKSVRERVLKEEI